VDGAGESKEVENTKENVNIEEEEKQKRKQET
jgi:hypothetical protein